jgi:hypothetical protein
VACARCRASSGDSPSAAPARARRDARRLAFIAAIAGSALYFLENAGHVAVLTPLTGIEHKYSRLLLITITVLVIGLGAFVLGLRRSRSLA